MQIILEQVKRCPLCLSADSGLFKKIDQWEIRSCSGCGLKRLDPRPSESEVARLYNDDYFKNRIPQDVARAIRQMNRSFRRRIKLIRHYCSGKTLLDIGCGEGDWLNYAKTMGYEAMGFDVSESAAKRANCPVIIGTVCKTAINGRFDIITCFHSLEHTPDPIAALEWLSEFLMPDGLLVVEVPNCESFDARRFDIEWEGWKLPFHLWHFDKYTLARALQKTGFKPLHWRFDSSKWLRNTLRKIPLISLTKGVVAHLKTGTAMLVVAEKGL